MDGGTGMREDSGSAFPSVQTVIPLAEGLKTGERHKFTTGVTNTNAPGKLERADGWPGAGGRWAKSGGKAQFSPRVPTPSCMRVYDWVYDYSGEKNPYLHVKIS